MESTSTSRLPFVINTLAPKSKEKIPRRIAIHQKRPGRIGASFIKGLCGAEMVGRLLEDLQDLEVRFTMARVRTSLHVTLKSVALEERIGEENFFLTVSDATKAFRGDGLRARRADGLAAGNGAPSIGE
jgi:hypothetical protein